MTSNYIQQAYFPIKTRKNITANLMMSMKQIQLLPWLFLSLEFLHITNEIEMNELIILPHIT